LIRRHNILYEISAGNAEKCFNGFSTQKTVIGGLCVFAQIVCSDSAVGAAACGLEIAVIQAAIENIYILGSDVIAIKSINNLLSLLLDSSQLIKAGPTNTQSTDIHRAIRNKYLIVHAPPKKFLENYNMHVYYFNYYIFNLICALKLSKINSSAYLVIG
jgi:hypothetical protein